MSKSVDNTVSAIEQQAVDLIPNVFIAGAPKAGTTALAVALSTHPEIAVSRFKEPQFFADDFRRRAVPSADEYVTNFLHGRNLKVKIDATTTYLYSRTAVPNIIRYTVCPRFIVILRDPTSMVPSWHSEMILDQSETLNTLPDAWLAIQRRREGHGVPRSCPYPPFLYYDDIAKYGEQLTRLLMFVPRDAVHVILYDDLVGAAEDTIVGVLRFLGVDPDINIHLPILNSRQEWRFPIAAKAVRLPFLQYVKRRTIGVGRLSWVAPLLFKHSHREPVPPDLLPVIRCAYQDDVGVLEALLQRSLGHWLS